MDRTKARAELSREKNGYGGWGGVRFKERAEG